MDTEVLADGVLERVLVLFERAQEILAAADHCLAGAGRIVTGSGAGFGGCTVHLHAVLNEDHRKNGPGRRLKNEHAGPNGIKGFISNNSWGAGTNGNAYDSYAAQYDGFVRDASAAAGVDPLLELRAAVYLLSGRSDGRLRNWRMSRLSGLRFTRCAL